MKKQGFSVTFKTPASYFNTTHRSGKFKALVFILPEYPVSLHYIRLYIYICSMNDSQMFTVIKSQKTKCTLRIYVKEIIESICVYSLGIFVKKRCVVFARFFFIGNLSQMHLVLINPVG